MRRKLAVLASLLLPLSALAEPDRAARDLRRQVMALQVDHALRLSKDQAKAMLPLLENAKTEIQAYEELRVAAEPALVDGLTRAVHDLKSSGAISDSTAETLIAAVPSTEPLRADLRSTWDKVKAILTPGQLNALDTVKLGIPPTGATSSGPTSRDIGFAQRDRLVRAVLSEPFIALVQERSD
jgi:hypothetical protein